MTSPIISCSLVVCHAGYQEVPALMRRRISEVIVLTHEAMLRMRGRQPRLSVLGLNPHAGEQGLFGNGEEESVIMPAIEAARTQGIEIVGPLPPDTAFMPSQRERTDAYVCMYHDQGLIPFKALAFETGVNTTLGLPIVRTSVDHGTASISPGKVNPTPPACLLRSSWPSNSAAKKPNPNPRPHLRLRLRLEQTAPGSIFNWLMTKNGD